MWSFIKFAEWNIICPIIFVASDRISFSSVIEFNLSVTIDQLVFGNIEDRPISLSKNRGELITNCVSALFDEQILATAANKINVLDKESAKKKEIPQKGKRKQQ